MSQRFVVQVGDPILRKVCKEVKNFNGELAALLDDMKTTVRAEDGAGLAAPQIGVDARVVVVDVEEGFFEFINPEIYYTKGEQVGPEGCLSVKGKQGTVARPEKVKLVYRDRTGKKHKLTAEGFFARAVCHELDHLDGVLYTDKAVEIYDIDAEGRRIANKADAERTPKAAVLQTKRTPKAAVLQTKRTPKAAVLQTIRKTISNFRRNSRVIKA